MIALLARIVGATICIVGGALIYLEGGAAETPPAIPRTHDVAPTASAPPALGMRAVRFFFGGGGSARSVAGVIHGVTLDHVIALGIPRSDLAASDDGVRFAFRSPPADLIGFAVVLPRGPLRWDLTLDGAPWPTDSVFAGPYGLSAPDLVSGIDASCAHDFASGAGTPFFSKDQVGVFVICEDR